MKPARPINKLPNSIMIITTVIFMDLLAGMEFDLFVPSFTQLQQHFNLAPFWVEALLSVNSIGYCISLFIIGHLADYHRRRPIILLGLFIFVIGSVFCLISDSYILILFGRFLQGLGVAAPAILSFLIVADRYPLKKQQFLMAMLNGSLNIAAGVAPVIGSYITLYFQWRGNFIALLLLGILVLAMTLFFIPKSSLPKNRPVTWSGDYKALFQSKSLLLLMGSLVVMFAPYWIFVGISPLLYIKSLHVSFQSFGFYQGILAFTFAVGSIVFGLIMHRYPQKKWLFIGLYFFIIALLFTIWISVTNTANPMVITLSMLIFVIAQIIPSAILYPSCLNLMPKAKAKISAIIQGARLALTALSLEIAGYFYKGSFQSTGIIIVLFILVIILTQYSVIKNKKIVKENE